MSIYGIDFSRSTQFLTHLSFQVFIRQTLQITLTSQSHFVNQYAASNIFCSSCDGVLLKLNDTKVDSRVYDDGLLEPTQTPSVKVVAQF